ncbi:hypothetical protein FF36_04581 [Frankia torreyi]|uniref:Uncharacterized protein n=1 Tax=Frankia torreyi TaxID=1856 RepID=A0A0D8BA59_9ACTN|nr:MULTISPECIES: DUF6182 family protein [Frankia]KJE21076.1 hypothetical protein FF36_04581 [Frankia torreyi]KQM03656.1 hypothetical protein FF86_103763 [Frankia sp. CpI1-P]
MRLSQTVLRAELELRVRALRPDLAPSPTAPCQAGEVWSSALGSQPPPDARTSAVVVLRSFDLPTWIRETCVFAARASPERAADWLRSFTRTVFLAGNPDNLRGRFRLDHVAPDGNVAWVGPGPDEETATLRRLLRTFDGERVLGAGPALTVDLPRLAPGPPPPAGAAAHGGPTGAPGHRRDLYLAVAGTTVARALVTINHLLVEAVLHDELTGPCRLRIHRVPRLVGLRAAPAALRVGADQSNPDRLQALACLTTEVHDGQSAPTR